ncbi:substrate-binding domain-containing protein [Jatrophihabitans sp. YIM 134969]
MHRSARSRLLSAVVVLATAVGSLTACVTSNDTVGVALILKTLTNPYFVAMRQAAQEKADAAGIDLSVAAGTMDGDTQNQINEIYTAIARGDKGILIASNGNSVNAAIRLARDNGLYVIALDTPPIPADVTDNTYATDNTQAGRLIGQYTAARLGGKKAVIAMLDLYDDQVASVDIERDHGFLEGMGIDPGSTSQLAQEPRSGQYKGVGGGGGGQYEIACHQPTQGAVDGGRTAMEQCLSANPDINVVYSVNEPAGRGAYAALQAAKATQKAFVVTIDGSCSGMESVKSGVFAADATQYPGDMAALGVEAVVKISQGQEPPGVTPGKTFLDTGTNLVATDVPEGVKAQTVDEGLSRCWGSTSDT